MQNYAYGLNIVLPATANAVSINSKRMIHDFKLISVQSAYMSVVNDWSVILGTEHYDWFASYCSVQTIFGDGGLPHFIPGGGVVIPKGEYIVVKSRNDEAVEKRIALLFQGIHV